MASKKESSSSCAGCKHLRRKCPSDCVFRPHFPAQDPEKFMKLHRLYSARNISKHLEKVDPKDREETVNSMLYEAEARLRDPVHGVMGIISNLRDKLNQLQGELHTELAARSTTAGYQQQQQQQQHQLQGTFVQFNKNDQLAVANNMGGTGGTQELVNGYDDVQAEQVPGRFNMY